MHKRAQSRPPEVDLTPVLGLVAILIPMLLMAYTPRVLAVIDSTPSSRSCSHCGPTIDKEPATIPSITITATGLVLNDVKSGSDEPLAAHTLPCPRTCNTAEDYDWIQLQALLSETLAATKTTGQVLIRPAKDVHYDVLVRAIDASRERVHPDGSLQALYPDPIVASVTGPTHP